MISSPYIFMEVLKYFEPCVRILRSQQPALAQRSMFLQRTFARTGVYADSKAKPGLDKEFERIS
jgi:hypothetical protein